jgi:Sec-independent protein secretion pathway component TatC
MWLLYELGMLMARFVVTPVPDEVPTESEAGR